MHRTTERFRQCFEGLPDNAQSVAKSSFQLLKDNPRHPSLHFKKIGELWSVRVGLAYRALAVQDGNDYIWVWIGNHDEYKRLYHLNR